jgi:hypothetical protein
MLKISLFAVAAFVLAAAGGWVASTTRTHVDARILRVDACAWQSREESRSGCPSIKVDFANWISPPISPVIGSFV